MATENNEPTIKDAANTATGLAKVSAGQIPTISEVQSTAKVAGEGIKIQLGCCVGLFFLSIFIGLFVINLLNPGSSDATSIGATQTGGSAASKPASKAEWIGVYKYAASLMQIEWEFLAAITKQETGMGNNFGRCSYFAPAPSKGHVLTDGNGLRSAADKAAFEKIMTKLGMPMNTPVSCNPASGNGGAMGYTQFMPREWSGGASATMQGILGHYPNPWNASDATVMAGQLLKGKVGIKASAPMPVDEALYRRAASKYYGDGNPNGKYANSVYSFYLKIKSTQSI